MRNGPRDSSNPKVTVRSHAGPEKPVRRDFPGPRQADAPLRVAFERAAYADLVAHAKQSLEAEVGGVLVGQFAQDAEGTFVHVEAIIQATAATEGATHVTFTQATWEAIHQTLERDHRGRRIIGWYHTHPGFGVEFSEMDLFIQKNFFSGPGQVALVMDPMSGAVAIAFNGPQGIEYLPRFWVDAREQLAKTPVAAVEPAATTGGAAGTAGGGATSVSAIEARLNQLIQAHDDLRSLLYRFLYGVGFILALGFIATFGYFFYNQYTKRYEPPELNSYVPIPLQVGNKTVLVGVGVVQWDVPPEINAVLDRLAKEKASAEAKAKQLALPDGSSVAPTADPNAAAPKKP